MKTIFNKKTTISVVVPVYNELKSLKELIERLEKTLSTITSAYEIVFIDDHSTDGTYEFLNKQESYKIAVYKKEGKKGKSFSLIEGFQKAKGEIVAMIDADLQYPPEALEGMIQQMGPVDLVIANRKREHSTTVRSFLSKGFRYAFGEFLFSLPYDVQSGLKVFKKEVFQTVLFDPMSGWTFDLEFLHRARHAGYKIANYDIDFSERQNGSSKVGFVKTSWEIGSKAVALKVKKVKPFFIPAKNSGSMIGAGIRHKKGTYITHTTLPHNKSALETFHVNQKLSIMAGLVIITAGLIVNALITLQIIISVLSTIYFIDALFNFFVVLQSLRKPQEITVSPKELKKLDIKKLPLYSILCPLYKEAHVIPQFLKAIAKLDWPAEKLDVMLLLEDDDKDTISAVKKMRLPGYVRVVVVPDSQPKTKPKACNYGLSVARGEYLVIYDAEDIPDPLQLKKAYLTFKKVPANIICLQAKLNYYNPFQNFLTRLFTAEYSLWFDITLPGLQSTRSSLPLGGTSNHFKTSQLRSLLGWDPFNVTEDADLGIRLFKEGYMTAMIDSTTLEEANSQIKNWLRQRSRWIKGYMQTYLVHMRSHENGTNLKGIHSFIFQLTVGGKLAFILINPILWITTILYFTLYHYVGETIESLYITPVFYMAVFSLVFGNFMFIYLYMIGCAKRNQWSLIKYVYFVPFYWLLISIAGQIALYQLLFKPHYWEKTIHGLHLVKTQDKSPELVIEISGTGEQPASKPEEKPLMPERPSRLRFLVNSIAAILRSNGNAFSGLLLYKSPIKPKKTKMRILIFNWRDTHHKWAGGAEVYIDELAKRWAKDGNDITVFCGNDGESEQTERKYGVRIIRCGGFFTVYVWAFLYYITHFKKEFDVIIDSENGVPFFTPFYSQKPVILLIHHIHQDIFTKHLTFPFSRIAQFAESFVMPKLYRNKTVVTVSNSSKKEIIDIGFKKIDKIEIVHPGINSKSFTHLKKANYPLFSYVGRLKPYKNIDVALKAFARILHYLPAAKLMIAGNGECLGKLSKLAKKLGIQDRVVFMGRVTDRAKASVLAKSWAVIQPSTLEGWGITVIEANASQTPVIASNVNGLRDSVVHGQTGLLVEMKNIDDFAAAMLAISSNTRLRDRLSRQAYQWSKQFSWDKSAQTSYEIIERAVEQDRVRPLFGGYAVAQSK